MRSLVSNSLYAKKDRNALPVPTKSLLKVSPGTAILFAPFGCTHPPPNHDVGVEQAWQPEVT